MHIFYSYNNAHIKRYFCCKAKLKKLLCISCVDYSCVPGCRLLMLFSAMQGKRTFIFLLSALSPKCNRLPPKVSALKCISLSRNSLPDALSLEESIITRWKPQNFCCQQEVAAGLPENSEGEELNAFITHFVYLFPAFFCSLIKCIYATSIIVLTIFHLAIALEKLFMQYWSREECDFNKSQTHFALVILITQVMAIYFLINDGVYECYWLA